jgi:nitroimidazol reductase NimA-like FMN-containing flavoprotein (pyridoxamine 5'-phosphate oxidase superfamily)
LIDIAPKNNFRVFNNLWAFMRRKEREIKDVAAIEDILKRAFVCRLGLCEDNQPYVVPLCHGYKDNSLSKR